MSDAEKTAIPQVHAFRVTRTFQALLRLGLALVPFVAIAYLQLFQDPSMTFRNHGIHELAIAVSTLLSGFITYVTWVCYRSSGEVFLRWLVLGLLGFTLLYALHGLFTGLSEHHPYLFAIYGPVSRLAMAACCLVAMRRFGVPAEEPGDRRLGWFWWTGLGVFAAAAVLAGVGALFLPGWMNLVRKGVETLALVTSALAIIAFQIRPARSPLMMAYIFSLSLFAQSSLSFLLASEWSHQWWLAHAIFAAGFFVLSYGIIQAYHTTRSFSAAYSQEEVMEQLRLEKLRADQALVKLEDANQRLLALAATDALTGAANRRQYGDRVVAEVARAQRKGFPLALLALDVDHFKQVNDAHGHPAGDAVLKAFVGVMQAIVRPSDLVTRTGGEEFKILLPDTGLEEAVAIAERVRSGVAAMEVRLDADAAPIGVTVSIGCALLVGDMASTETVADERLYLAKTQGRNRVVWRDATTGAENGVSDNS
ncbi:diguanylate cyclase [Rhodanobacter sp. T12-5]|uniref:GGDEF domain-containing protein n=1 Tax=Rhodanobacter sp. T12-5 TaxID=2024611 RepID=UPI0011EF1A8F|nr:diguanylate cyclase [Rhodanobacter sp. T12-5]KAA0069137.1 diguanylate cyclase [Rhodanobacter sp. T12-5]